MGCILGTRPRGVQGAREAELQCRDLAKTSLSWGALELMALQRYLELRPKGAVLPPCINQLLDAHAPVRGHNFSGSLQPREIPKEDWL